MYCPSCDKSYGAIHSRCPECHSWLKVSAPSRGKGGKQPAASAQPAASSSNPMTDRGAVSTMDRESDNSSISWADPSPTKDGGQWGDSGSSGGWDTGGLGGASSQSSSDSPWGDNSGGGGGAWGSSPEPSSAWGGNAPASAPPAAPPEPKSKGGGSGWLGGDDANDGWGGGAASTPSTPSTPAPPKSNGWLGEGADSGAASASGGSSSSGWLGGDDSAPQAGRGWLGDPQPASGGSGGGGGNGWLGDGPSDGPTMTEMVDQAINVEDDDEFVDDSWVDEEIRDNEFDDLEIPEYVAPTPEVGGAFLKMLLVAALVLLVGGGIIFLKSDSKTPEQKQAEEREKQYKFAVSTLESADKDLAAGKAELAIPQFEQALVALSEVEAPQAEVDSAEIKLSQAMMKAEKYDDAIQHWKVLNASADEAVAKTATEGLNAATRAKRIEANGYLKEAKKDAADGGTLSVRSLARDALEIYEKYDGSRTQIGDAYGVMGRGFLNATDYGSAEDNLEKAVKYAPNLGYQKYLAKVRAQTRPAYIPPVRVSAPVQSSGGSAPRLDLGSPSYKTNNTRYAPRRSAGNSNSGPSSSSAPAAKPKMQEIPAWKPKRNSGGGRKGSQGVLQTY